MESAWIKTARSGGSDRSKLLSRFCDRRCCNEIHRVPLAIVSCTRFSYLSMVPRHECYRSLIRRQSKMVAKREMAGLFKASNMAQVSLSTGRFSATIGVSVWKKNATNLPLRYRVATIAMSYASVTTTRVYRVHWLPSSHFLAPSSLIQSNPRHMQVSGLSGFWQANLFHRITRKSTGSSTKTSKLPILVLWDFGGEGSSLIDFNLSESGLIRTLVN